MSRFYEVVYCPVEGSVHVHSGRQGEKGGGMFTPEVWVVSRFAAEAMAVGFGFYRAGGWEWRYDAFWVAEVRRIMLRPPVTLDPPTIPDN